MASYTLAQPESDIVVSWLFEPFGYLDSSINLAGVSAREALVALPVLDVAVWIRTNARRADVGEDDWIGCGMVWWIWKNHQVNITPPTRPPETASWVTLLQVWDASLTPAAIQRGTDAGTTYTLHREDGSTFTQPLGQNRQHQKNLIGKVLGVLT